MHGGLRPPLHRRPLGAALPRRHPLGPLLWRPPSGGGVSPRYPLAAWGGPTQPPPRLLEASAAAWRLGPGLGRGWRPQRVPRLLGVNLAAGLLLVGEVLEPLAVPGGPPARARQTLAPVIPFRLCARQAPAEDIFGSLE